MNLNLNHVISTYETSKEELEHDFDYVEPYDPQKKYESGQLKTETGKIYEWVIYNNKWAVKEEIVSSSELKELAPFCQCPICLDYTPWWKIHTKILDLIFHRKCASCYGCLHSDIPNPCWIKKARQIKSSL